MKKTYVIARIEEPGCIGCGACVKVCPFGAIKITNLPLEMSSQVTHRYGPNSFKLHRLPVPRSNQVLGLVGTNGIGKSTALDILSGKIIPNLGDCEDPPDWKMILKFFRGSELQKFFNRMIDEDLKSVKKIQDVDSLQRNTKDLTIVG